MQAKSMSVAELLRFGPFQVPVYQRGYAWQEKQIKELSVHLRQGRVGMGRDVAPAGDMAVVGEGGGGDFHASAAQQVDGGKGLEFLEAVGKEHECGWHGGKLTAYVREGDTNFWITDRRVFGIPAVFNG